MAMALLSGCGLSLDSFLYTPKTTDAYVFDPVGETPEETVTADRIEPLTITAEGIELGAVLVRANEPSPRAHLLFFHGKTDHIGLNFDRIKRLSNLGYEVLAFDYRGFGTSTRVTPTEETVLRDSELAREYFVGRIGNADRLIYYGHSFGTAFSTQRAEVNPPKVLILESGFASLQAFIDDATGLGLPTPFLAEATWDTEGRLATLNMPVLLLHGTADDYVRSEFSERLYAVANEPKRLELVEGAEHGDVPETMGEAYRTVLHEFVGTHLP
jgi:alpha-beta hydrolase superfamily lysophospholipase